MTFGYNGAIDGQAFVFDVSCNISSRSAVGIYDNGGSRRVATLFELTAVAEWDEIKVLIDGRDNAPTNESTATARSHHNSSPRLLLLQPNDPAIEARYFRCSAVERDMEF